MKLTCVYAGFICCADNDVLRRGTRSVAKHTGPLVAMTTAGQFKGAGCWSFYVVNMFFLLIDLRQDYQNPFVVFKLAVVTCFKSLGTNILH